MNDVLGMLSGGDLRSEGRAAEAAARVIGDPRLLPRLAAGLTLDDKLIRARTCMCMEVMSRTHPGLLAPLADELLHASEERLPRGRSHRGRGAPDDEHDLALHLAPAEPEPQLAERAAHDLLVELGQLATEARRPLLSEGPAEVVEGLGLLKGTMQGEATREDTLVPVDESGEETEPRLGEQTKTLEAAILDRHLRIRQREELIRKRRKGTQVSAAPDLVARAVLVFGITGVDHDLPRRRIHLPTLDARLERGRRCLDRPHHGVEGVQHLKRIQRALVAVPADERRENPRHATRNLDAHPVTLVVASVGERFFARRKLAM